MKNSDLKNKALYRHKGFTLIELMIAVAVIGILASIAYPSYQRYVQDARRTEAKSALLDVAGAMERCRSANFTYTNCTSAEEVLNARNAELDFYTVAIDTDAITRNAFALTATPDSGSAQSSDRCGTLTIDATGNRGADDDNCW
ncbi:prepilin-type N-terminal cleavage/methylation domain-containing protein [Halomonas alimentaria]|uniref:Prepilin-type N-terminal cleavage/methylation domain-containing protein n=2 Tax=Halomonas alimentaria TaxID=147248 RepID=A0A7X5AMS9_9GAMM|nr:prepilin-type N-terminal cleavage/methylation domain-containing protein [Halomonas alimentaria]